MKIPFPSVDPERWASLSTAGHILLVLVGTVMLVPMGADALLGLLLLIVLWRLPDRRERLTDLCRDPLFLLALAVLVLQALSVSWSQDTSASKHAQTWLRAALIGCFLAALSGLLSERENYLLTFSKALTAGALLGAIIALGLFSAGYTDDGRLYALFRFDNPGRAARMFCASLPFALVVLLHGRSIGWQVTAAAALLLALLAIYFSDTRAAWLGSIMGLLTFAIASSKPRPRRFAAAVGVSGAAVLATAALLYVFFPELALPRGDSFRLQLWQTFLRDVIIPMPLFGWGIASEHWMQIEHLQLRDAHNLYLALLAQTGFPGFALFATLMGLTVYRLTGHLERVEAVLGISLLLLAATIFLFTGDRIVDKVNMIWLTIWFAVAVALSLRARATAPSQTATPRHGAAAARADTGSQPAAHAAGPPPGHEY